MKKGGDLVTLDKIWGPVHLNPRSRRTARTSRFYGNAIRVRVTGNSRGTLFDRVDAMEDRWSHK